MNYCFTIQGKLEGMNKYTEANRSNPYKGSRMKRDNQQVVMWAIKQQLKDLQIKEPVRIHYKFYEPNKRRDLDNISAFAHKVIQDALVKCQILKNDGWKEIVGYTDQFYQDKENPRIEVILEIVE